MLQQMTGVVALNTVIIGNWDMLEDWRACCRLEQAEEKYRNREPREQDLEMIDQLKGAIHRLEASVKQLTVSSIYVFISTRSFWLLVGEIEIQY